MLPDYMAKWKYIEEIWRSHVKTYGYGEIVTPMFEHTELFVRGAGDTSDVVSKEMYTFLDRGDRQLSLRPEGTAPVVRAYLEEKLYTWPQPVKLFYVAPMFRYERPQAGRLRQHWQYGIEVIGSPGPFTDAEVLRLLVTFYHKLGIDKVKLYINSIGDKNCRPAYREKLLDYLRSVREHLCEDCQQRMERNPLRVLDCKQESCQVYLQAAPLITDYLCAACQEHFDGLRGYLDTFGIAYDLNPRLVRGLDYYSRTAFEIHSQQLGAQAALAGGGRYDGLIELLGGTPTPALGFGAGMERLIFVMEQLGIALPAARHLDVFVISLGEAARNKAIELLWQLRDAGIVSDLDHLASDKMKAQITRADRLKARYALIIGQDELSRGEVGLRDLATMTQESVAMSEVVSTLHERLASA